MRLALSVTIALAGSLGLAPVALAQGGNGLYEPFPDGIRKDRAVLFVERLGLGEGPHYTVADLERGEFLDGAGPESLSAGGESASRRAGVWNEGGGSAPVLWLSLLGAALLGMALLGGRRPRPRVEAR
jgi:hypothetical protein